MDTFDYSEFFNAIKNKVSENRIKASRQINSVINDLYWFIGKMIAESQNQKGWGTSVVENLSGDLKNLSLTLILVFQSAIYGI